jgi:hypothetical protein
MGELAVQEVEQMTDSQIVRTLTKDIELLKHVRDGEAADLHVSQVADELIEHLEEAAKALNDRAPRTRLG